MRPLLFAAALCSALACRSAAPAPTSQAAPASSPPLTFGVVPSQSQEEQREKLLPLVRHLERKLGVEVRFEIPATYREMARGLAEGRWDLAYTGPILYSRAHELTWDAVAVPVRDGRTTVPGLLLARKDRGLGGLGELRGRRIGFVDPRSSAGFQYQFALLYANGLPPGSYERIFLGTHHAVVRAVLAGEVDAGATYGGAAEEILDGAQLSELGVIGETDPVASDVFAIRRGATRADEVTRALLELNESPEVLKILEPFNAQSLAPADESSFDSARKIDLLVSEQGEL